jgi:Dolichyl-phosphate-mannose-protein mannosyltransferase
MRRMRRLRAWLDGLPAVWLGLAVVAGQLAVLLPMAIARNIDGDEGYYTLAASLVSDGKLPYQDFFYPQMPLLPFAYGPWTAIFGETWLSARSLSVICATAAGLLLFRHVSGRWRSQALGVLAVALYLSSMLVLVWMTVVKTYPLSTLILFAAFTAADRPDRPQTTRRWLAAGVLYGLALDSRLLFAAAGPVLGWYALRAAPGAAGRRLGAAWLGGTLLGLLPSIVLFALDPRRFWFHNLGYHSVRSPGGLFGDLGDKLEIVWELVSDNPQFTLLLVAGVGTLIACRRLGRRVPLAYPLAASLAVASLAPNPPFVQDFATTVPFLVVGAMELVALLPELHLDRRLAVALTAALVFYLAVPLVELPRAASGGYLGGGDYIADTLRPSAVRAVTREIDAHSRPGERVLAFWPGYLFGSHADPVPGFENDFATQGVVNAGYSDAKARRYLLASPEFVDEEIRRRRAPLVAIGPLGDWTKRHDSMPLILRSGYRVVARAGVTSILTRGRPGPEAALERCLRAAGLRPALSPRVRDAALVSTPLPGGRAQVFVYPGVARARHAVPEVIGFLGLEAAAVRAHGPAVVALIGAPEPGAARAVSRCADRLATAAARLG